MKTIFVSFFTLLIVFVFTVTATKSSKGLTCEQEKALAKQCLDYLTKKSDAPSTSYCYGMKQIIFSSPMKEEKRAACKCLKESGSQVPNLDKDKDNNLCKECKIMSNDLNYQK
ncbi:non-specific lipid-transfer protein A-like [Vigna angularis]|uniref:non-specific lipid-transfer protein A-like n=1 Tax=Phaseolus angularis TaxID=3914 RepID=UPI0022B4F558|nr:non-specific lipid-transfer protein A-like [Vigna angularis]